MFLLIFESIGTQELVIIGIVALVFLGPRKLPEYARKIGKLMAEFRSTTSDFKETWQREVNFEEEAKALRLDDLESEPVEQMSVENPAHELAEPQPEIKTIDKEEFERRLAERESTAQTVDRPDTATEDKRNWL